MVEKAITQPAPAVASTPLTTVIPVDEGNVGSVNAVAVPSHEKVVNTKRKRRWRKFKRLRARDRTVIAAKERKVEVIGEAEVLDPNSAETNTVLRKLLRGPRYFDPSNSSWSNCFNCGEEGHVAAFCTSEMKKKQKPCFVCGISGHDGKQCSKVRACYICKQIGHLARRCPDKEKHGLGSSIICLKCGQSGHEMFSCENDYSPSDLKEIQCYICRSFGHVCCVDSVDIFSSKVSCYRCGQLGHTGLACSRQRGGNEGETTPSSCHPCGEEGHILIECKNASKGEATPISIYDCGEGGDLSGECKNLTKMSNGKEEEASKPNSGHNCGVAEHFAQAKIPKRKRHDDEEHKDAKSEPKNLKANKRKKQDKDKKITTPQKPPKNNGGSIKAEPGKKSFRQSNKNSSTAPRKPSNTDHMAKAAPGKKSFRPSNKNSSRSSSPRPSYTGHHVTRVAPVMYHHHYSHQSAAADIALGGQVYNPQYATGHIYQPQSSSSPQMFQYGASAYTGFPRSPHISSSNPHMFQHGYPSPYHDSPHIFSPNPRVFHYEASAYPGFPRSPHISSSNPHMFQHGYPSPYHDSPHIFSPNPRVFHYEASAYRGSPVSPSISPFNSHRFQDADSSAYRGSQRSPPRISANPHRFQYGGDSSANPHRFQYGDSSAYGDLPRYPRISSSDLSSVEYGDSLPYRGLPRSPHISSPGPHEFRYRDSSYLGSLDAPQPSAASPFWNHGSNGSWRNQGW